MEVITFTSNYTVIKSWSRDLKLDCRLRAIDVGLEQGRYYVKMISIRKKRSTNLATITAENQNRDKVVELDTTPGFHASGRLNIRERDMETGYHHLEAGLELTWDYPKQQQSGSYECSVLFYYKNRMHYQIESLRFLEISYDYNG